MASHMSFTVRHNCARLLVIMGMIAAGCGVDVGDEEVEVDMFLNLNPKAGGSAGSGGDPDTNNTLDDDCLNLPGVVSTIQALGQGPIANANNYLPAMPNLPSSTSTAYPGCRRELLKIVVECALHGARSYIDPLTNQPVFLPADVVMDGGDGYRGLPRTYYGRHGLAPAWETRALTADEQEFVSACVMARTNYFGAEKNILMQGRAPIATNHELREQYTYGESIVWGNLFTPTRSMHICHSPFNDLCFLHDQRICEEPQSNYCGFTNHGDCFGVATTCPPNSISPHCHAWPNRIAVFLDISGAPIGCTAPLPSTSLP